MKREIKFRGISTEPKSQGDWVYGFLHTNIGTGSLDDDRFKNLTFNNHWILQHRIPTDVGWSIRDSFKAFIVLPESVGQFTGLKDCKGVEIYEGDVVKLEWKDIEVSPVEYEDQTDVCVVDFHSGVFWLKHVPLYVHCEEQEFCEDLPKCEVIGNIHQNPELL